MKPSWIRAAAAMPTRQLHLMAGGVLLIVAAGLWVYALRAPLAELRTVRAEQALLASGGGDARLLAAQLAALDTETRALARRVGGVSGEAARQAVGLLGQIGALAQAHGVKLHGATPAPEQQVLAFTQVGFDAHVSGSYAALLAWMRAIEQSPAGLSVAGFDMHAAQTPGQVDMNIRIAAFRPQETNR
jgi:type II secretory pathway component PulM